MDIDPNMIMNLQQLRIINQAQIMTLEKYGDSDELFCA